MFHKGHEYFLSTAKKHGTQLHTIVARDETVQKVKGFYPHEHQEQRKKNVGNFSKVDFCYVGSADNILEIPLQICPDVFVQGYDQIIPSHILEQFKKLLPDCIIIKVGSHFPEKYKSSILRKEKQYIN